MARTAAGNDQNMVGGDVVSPFASSFWHRQAGKTFNHITLFLPAFVVVPVAGWSVYAYGYGDQLAQSRTD